MNVGYKHTPYNSSSATGLYCSIKRSTFSSKAMPSKLFWLRACAVHTYHAGQAYRCSYTYIDFTMLWNLSIEVHNLLALIDRWVALYRWISACIDFLLGEFFQSL